MRMGMGLLEIVLIAAAAYLCLGLLFGMLLLGVGLTEKLRNRL